MNVLRAARLKPVAAAVLAAFAVAAAGGAVTRIDDWYRSLVKPSWQPPDWAFGPAWTLIFGLAAAAGVLGWRAMPSHRHRMRLLGAFALNGTLNVAWSALFFLARRPDLALYEVGLLWLSILLLMHMLRPWSARAAALLLPYAAWVAFAAALNGAVVSLNGPFG